MVSVEGRVCDHIPLLARHTFKERAKFSVKPCSTKRQLNHKSLALLWTEEIPCSCLKALWLQGPWSDRWPKMDAFSNIAQVYLHLSPPLSLRVCPLHLNMCLFLFLALHHALCLLWVVVLRENVLLLLCPCGLASHAAKIASRHWGPLLVSYTAMLSWWTWSSRVKMFLPLFDAAVLCPFQKGIGLLRLVGLVFGKDSRWVFWWTCFRGAVCEV